MLSNRQRLLASICKNDCLQARRRKSLLTNNCTHAQTFDFIEHFMQTLGRNVASIRIYKRNEANRRFCVVKVGHKAEKAYKRTTTGHFGSRHLNANLRLRSQMHFRLAWRLKLATESPKAASRSMGVTWVLVSDAKKMATLGGLTSCGRNKHGVGFCTSMAPNSATLKSAASAQIGDTKAKNKTSGCIGKQKKQRRL